MRALTFGTFDDFHPGHQSYLEQAAKLGQLFVIIARDANVTKIKGHAPMQNENERKAAIEHAFPEATVILGNPDDFFVPVRELKPDLIVLGYDQGMPPGISESDFPCPIKRAEPFEPQIHKSSLRRVERS